MRFFPLSIGVLLYLVYGAVEAPAAEWRILRSMGEAGKDALSIGK
jgi:hypothetical protein